MIKKIVSQLRKILISRVEIQAVKGYYDIQETNSDLVHEIKEKIADYQLKTEPSVIENIIFPKNINIQLSLQQYLLITLLGNMFTRFILFCIHELKLSNHRIKKLIFCRVRGNRSHNLIKMHWYVII